jgi:hypothetical protein
VIVKKDNPLLAKSRLPFSPTIRPSLAGGQGGVSVLLYAIVAVVLAGYGLYQIKVLHLDLSNWRVLIALGGAGYFVVRAAMMLAIKRIDKNDDEGDGDETGEGA